MKLIQSFLKKTTDDVEMLSSKIKQLEETIAELQNANTILESEKQQLEETITEAIVEKQELAEKIVEVETEKQELVESQATAVELATEHLKTLGVDAIDVVDAPIKSENETLQEQLATLQGKELAEFYRKNKSKLQTLFSIK